MDSATGSTKPSPIIPVGLYKKLDEVAKQADAGDPAAQRFMVWFVSPETHLTFDVDPDGDIDAVTKASSLFIAARRAACSMDNGSETPPKVRITINVEEAE